MYLKEIIINGFKSFADRTCLDLQRGVTAVVGPNGCGKSNIVDAIRWVLGEQSAKALRGASMQDVIFEGTDKRKGLPTCEVSLTFADCELELGTAFNEVEVTRRVTREGGSDYYINGKVSRLKDIQRLFANTGIGRVSYSFMLQGQIDQVLSTNPAERRVIFEEAAGITLYKGQRKEALNKLALVDTNLARLTDVIDEVSRQIGSLKRQASKALRYQRLKYRLTHLDLASCAHRFKSLKESIDELTGRVSELKKQLETHSNLVAHDEQKLASRKTERAELYKKIQELQQRVFNLRSEKEHAESQVGFSDVRMKDFNARIAEYEKEVKDLEKQQGELVKRAKSEAENRQTHLNFVDDSGRVFRDQSVEFNKVQEHLDTLERQLQQSRQKMLEAENKINRSRSRCTTLEVDLKTYQVTHASLAETILALKEETVVLEKTSAAIKQLLLQRREAQKNGEAALEKAREDSKSLLQKIRSTQKEAQEQDRNIAGKTTRLSVLENLQAQFEGFGEGAQAILKDKLAEIVSTDDVAILSRALHVEPDYTIALDALLGQAMEAISVGDSAKVLSVIAKLDEEKLGRACFQIDLEADCTNTPDIQLPKAIVSALSAVLVEDENLKKAVKYLLANCYFAENLEAFVQFWETTPGFNFLYAATLKGELIDGRGLIYGGRTSSEKSVNMIERESEIRKLRKEIQAERKVLNVSREQLAELEKKNLAVEAIVEEQRQRLTELTSEVSGLVNEEKNHAQKLTQNADLHRKRSEELERLEVQNRDSVQAMETAQQKLIEAEKGLSTERQRVAELEDAIAQARKASEQKREALSEVRFELAEKKQRLESVDRTLNEVQREEASLQTRITQRQQEIDTLNEQIKQFENKRSSELGKSKELLKTLQIATVQLSKDRADLEQADSEITLLDASLSKKRNEGRSSDQEVANCEVRLAEARAQASFLINSVEENYQVQLQQIDWKVELWKCSLKIDQGVNLDVVKDIDEFAEQIKQEAREPTEEELASIDQVEWPTVEVEVSELKERISTMGPVNLDAIGEYTDLRERHEFLKAQSEDLWNAKNALVKSIDEINETSQALFSETLEQVRKNFVFTYEKLSGGGVSDLVLVDSEDPLESGIDIIARPPGTRLKNVSLLSGGQRTMAAVALLFAIYLVKPSPFCVLDEIDAALDDANIGRFCEMLLSFTKQSQFLIVTHNKRTISNADTVFGVTMPEKGVSKMLSMQ
ncbi:MAG: chromosome segregation protein, partial [Zhongshania aliphaticivorans]